MSVLDKLLDAVKLNDDYDEDDYLDDDLLDGDDDDFLDEDREDKPVKKFFQKLLQKNPKRMTMMISMMNRRLLFPNSPHPNPSLFPKTTFKQDKPARTLQKSHL